MKRNTLNGLSIETVRKNYERNRKTVYKVWEHGYISTSCLNITELCQWLEWRYNLPEIKAITPMKRFNRIIKLIEG
jgi:hypothetical protein